MYWCFLGYQCLYKENTVLHKFNYCFVDFASKGGKSPAKKQIKLSTAKSPAKKQDGGQQTKLSFVSPSKPSQSSTKTLKDTTDDDSHLATASNISDRDNSFRQFRRLCEDIENEASYNAKTKLVATYLKHGNSGGKQ